MESREKYRLRDTKRKAQIANAVETVIIETSEPGPAPDWPDTRCYEDIIALHHQNTQEAAKKNELGIREIAEELPDNATVIDIGAGKGQLISDLRDISKHKGLQYNLIAVSANRLDDCHISSANYVYYQKVPDNKALLKNLAGKADLVLDTFGAATYAKNPIYAVAYGIFLLKPGGQYSAISSLIPDVKDGSAIGNSETQDNLTKLFNTELNITLHIRPTYLQSKVKGNEGKIVRDLLISAQRLVNCQHKFSVELFMAFCQKIDRIIGKPKVIGVWKKGIFGQFQIRQIAYEKDDNVQKALK